MNNGQKFFGVIFLLALSLFLVPGNLATNVFRRFNALFIHVFPGIVLVFLLIFAFNLFLEEEKIKKYFSAKKGKNRIWAVGLGVLSGGPIYAWYPLLADLRKKGLDDFLIVSFLYGRAIKLPMIPFLFFYFSVKIVVIWTLVMVVFAFLNGEAFRLLEKK